MKNILLSIVSIMIALCMAEVTVRCFINSAPSLDIVAEPTERSEHGYWLNPNLGMGRAHVGKQTIWYHYYSPHLKETPIHPQANHILVLGDSFTFGTLLPWDQTYVYRLQVAADDAFGRDAFQFLNAATGGWGAADYLAYLNDFGPKIAPKYVLVFLSTDDIGRSVTRDIYKLADSHSLQLIQNYHLLPYAHLKSIIYDNWLFKHSELLQFVRYEVVIFLNSIKSKQGNTFVGNTHPIPASPSLVSDKGEAVRLGEGLFVSMNNWCKQHNATLLVVTTGFNQFYPQHSQDPTKAFLDEAKSFFAKENIPYYDIAPEFIKNVGNKNYQIPDNGHPNEFGSEVIAQISWPWIKDHLSS